MSKTKLWNKGYIFILLAAVFAVVPDSRRGVANSTYMLFGDIGLGIGASIWGVSSAYDGFTLTYLLSAVVIVTAAAVHTVFLVPRYSKVTAVDTTKA